MGMGDGSAIHHVHFVLMGISTLPLQPAFQLCGCLSESSPVPHPLLLGHWSIFSCSGGKKVKGICSSKNWCLWQLGFSPLEFVILEERWM